MKDEIRRSLPEYSSYAEQVPELVDRMTGKEAGYIGETMLWAALREGKNVVLDSCLKDACWYAHLVDRVRAEHGHYKVALLHVTCPDAEVLCDRSRRRARETGREIPARAIAEQAEGIPTSIEAVAPVVDRYYAICNDADLCLRDGVTWEEFADAFRSRRHPEEMRRKKGPSPATCSSHKRRSCRRISVLRSSEENHKSDDRNFYGKYAHLRKTLDYTVRQLEPVSSLLHMRQY
jgi:predicted kinase